MATSSRRPRTAAATTRASGRSGRATVVLVVVLMLVAGAVAAWRYDLLDSRLDALLSADGPDGPGDPTSDPAAVAPPPGLDLAEVRAPDPVAQATSTGGALDAGAVRRVLAPYLRDRDLGRHVRAAVAPLGGGPTAFAFGQRPAIPASTTKLVTGVAALLALGPDHVFSTTAHVSGARGTRADLTLVGGGDPLLERAPTTPDGEPWPYPARADVSTLAEEAAAALRDQGVRRVRLSYDEGLFTGPATNPRWEDDYVPGVVTPTSALWVDQGRTLTRFSRVDDPSREAAAAFADALRAADIAVVGAPTAAAAPSSAEVIAEVESASLAQVVQRVISVSDNEASEVLLRHIGLAEEGVGSSVAGQRATRALLAAAGVRLGSSTFFDGSGLSRANRAEPDLLIEVLRLAADPTRPELRAVVEGLPVAGFTGSLSTRMDAGPPAGLGRVRAKTGTLTAVSSLAGIGTTLDGTLFAFVLMADRIRPLDTVDARQDLDSAAAALGACRCG